MAGRKRGRSQLSAEGFEEIDGEEASESEGDGEEEDEEARLKAEEEEEAKRKRAEKKKEKLKALKVPARCPLLSGFGHDDVSTLEMLSEGKIGRVGNWLFFSAGMVPTKFYEREGGIVYRRIDALFGTACRSALKLNHRFAPNRSAMFRVWLLIFLL